MHTAQHSNLSHIDFHIGSGLAGVYQVGNLAYNLRFYGGRYGILAEKTSPAWQFTLLDSSFDGQRDAAIREHEAGLTLVNTEIRNTPVGVEIDRGYGDWLWGKDVRFENVSARRRSSSAMKTTSTRRSASTRPARATCRCSRASATAARPRRARDATISSTNSITASH
jgi:hypothetical protein